MEYWINLRKEADEKLQYLLSEYKNLTDERKKLWTDKVSKDRDNIILKEQYQELSHQIDRVQEQLLIVRGQLSVIEKIINFDSPLIIGKELATQL